MQSNPTQIALRREYFGPEDSRKVKEHLFNSMNEHFTLTSDNCYVLSQFDNANPIFLESYWKEAGYPKDFLVAYQDESELLIGVVIDGCPHFDCRVNISAIKANSYETELAATLLQLQSLESLYVSSNCVEQDDDGLTIADCLRIDTAISQSITHVALPQLDGPSICVPVTKTKLHVPQLNRTKSAVAIKIAASIAAISIVAYLLMPEKTPPPPPPKIIDKWESYRDLLTEQSINVRMRGLTIYSALKDVNDLNGFKLSSIEAVGDVTDLVFESIGGNSFELKRFGVEKGYLHGKRDKMHVLQARVDTIPIMKKAYRINIDREEAHLRSFLEDYYPEIVELEVNKPLSKGTYIEKSVELKFKQFTMHDIDTLSIALSPHPFSFQALVAKTDGSGYLNGTLKLILIGVNDED
jgi:hypothetical protein